MVKNSFAKIYASTIAPDPAMDALWMDLSEDPLGSIIKFWDGARYIPISLGNAGELGNVLASIAADIAQAKSEAISQSNSYTDAQIALINLNGYMTVDASNSNIGVLSFNQNPPAGNLTSGQMKWDSTEGTMELGMNGGNVSQSIGLELLYRVNNKTQIDIVNGDLVSFDGTDGNSGKINIKKALPGENPNHILGIATENIFQGESGFVTWFGKVRGIQTNGANVSETWSSGSVLYPHPSQSGKLTNVEPLLGNKLPVAVVISAHGHNGSLFVRAQRSVRLQDINDVDVSTAVTGQPLTKQSNGSWKNSSSIKISQIDPLGSTVSIPAAVTVNSLSATDISTNTAVVSSSMTAPGYKIPAKTNNDFVMASGGTLPINTLKSGIYQLYNPANNTQVVLEASPAGQILINGDIIVNGDAFKIDAEEISTTEQTITLRSDATLGMPIDSYAGFIIKLYDGVNDGMIVIDNHGTLRIGDVGDLQPLLTREEAPVDMSPMVFNESTKRAETVPATDVKTSLADADTILIKDSADSNKPKWWSFANIKANLKTYFDSLFLRLADVSQTVAGTITFSKSPVVPLPVNNTDAANKAYVQSVITVGNDTYQENKLITDARVASLENTINSANINQETTATVTGVDTVALPKTAANTGMQVQLYGQSAEQLVTNGNFEAGVPTPWAGGLPTLVSDVFRVGSKSGYINVSGDISYFRKDIACSATDKLYITSSYRLKSFTSGSTPSIRIQDFGGFTNINQLNALTTSVVDTWYDFSYVVNGRDGGIRYTLGYYSSATVQFYVDNIKIINLTATFGAGNEPTKEQCDVLFANYFEGSDNVLGTGRVRSVGKNLILTNISNWEQGSISTSTGGNTTSDIAIRLKNYFNLQAGVGYIASSVSGYLIRAVHFYDKNKVWLSSTAPNPTTFTAPINAVYARVHVVKQDLSTITINNLDSAKPQIERGSTATTYEPYRPSSLYLTTPELRSNGLIKDEIRKGTNGYELVKRVGVGTLGSDIITNGTFDSDTAWNKGTGWTIGGGVAVATNVGSGDQISQSKATIGKWYKIVYTLTVTGGSFAARAGAYGITRTASGTYSEYLLATNANIGVAGVGSSNSGTVDNYSAKEVTASEAIAAASTFTEIGSNVHFTLATPTIIPIAHAGLLNSNSNGTAYFEPIIADAGVYASNLAIQLTDYPIASFESIRKYVNGTYTELNTATAVIASGGLSFTHPNLTAGDLVMFTYAYANESIGRSMTLTYAISNSNPYYNVTNSVPLTTGYYTSTTARAAVPEGIRKTGLILTYETAAGVWYTERYIGTATDTTSWTTAGNWEIGVLRIAAVTDTTEYAEITI